MNIQLDTFASSPEDRAWRAYFRYPGEAILDQPARGLGGLREHKGKAYVVLENNYRTLAVYRVCNDGRLRRLMRWPKAIDEFV